MPLKKFTLKEAPQHINSLLKNGETFGEYDTIYHCLQFGWLNLYGRQNRSFFVETLISSDENPESKVALLERLSKSTYGKEAMMYQCITKGYLELEEVDGELLLHRELRKELPQGINNIFHNSKLSNITRKLPF